MRSEPGATPVTIEALFPATPDRLFRAWTEPSQLRRWFGVDPDQLAEIEIDLVPGGRWRFTTQSKEGAVEYLEGEYLKIEPARLLVFTWMHRTTDDNGQFVTTPQSKVSIDFEPQGHATRMRLVHAEIASEPGRLGVRKGWLVSYQALVQFLMEEV